MKQDQSQQNPKNVDALLERAAKGDAEAQFQLACAYAKGDLGLPQDNTQAVSYFEQSAANGHAGAQFYLGIAYAFGNLGFPQDNTQALAYYQQSAANGNASAQFILGAAYANGNLGLPQDNAQAVSYFEQSAANGDADAQRILGAAYALGNLGLPQDNAQAVAYYQQSAANGDAKAQFILGAAYAFGNFDLSQDNTQAISYFEQSAANGDAEAQFNLGVAYADGLFDLPQDDAQAVAYYLQSAANGNLDAQFKLGLAYAKGELGLPQDNAKAVSYYLQSADSGFALAQFVLVKFYAKYLSTEKCQIYCRLAAEQGHLGAKLLLANDFLENKAYNEAYLLCQEVYQFKGEKQQFGTHLINVVEYRLEAAIRLIELFVLHRKKVPLICECSRVICEMIALRLCLELVCQRDERAQELLLKVLQHARRLSTSWMLHYFHLFISRWNPSLVGRLAVRFGRLADAVSTRYFSSNRRCSSDVVKYLSLFEMDYGELIGLIANGELESTLNISTERLGGKPTLQQVCIYSFVRLVKTLFRENAPNGCTKEINITLITKQLPEWKNQFGVLPKEGEVGGEEYARLSAEREQRIDEEIKITLMPLQDFLNGACVSFRNSTTTVVRSFG